MTVVTAQRHGSEHLRRWRGGLRQTPCASTPMHGLWWRWDLVLNLMLVLMLIRGVKCLMLMLVVALVLMLLELLSENRNRHGRRLGEY